MLKCHHFNAIALAIVLLSAPALAQAPPAALSQDSPPQDSQPATRPDRLGDISALTRLLVCLRDRKPSECEADDRVPTLLSHHRLGKIVLKGTPELGRTIGTTNAERDAFLMDVHNVYKQFKGATSTPDERAEVAQLGTQIHERLSEVGLNPPLNAVLRGGYTLADAGDEFPRKFDTGAPLQSSALGFIEFESKHFGHDSRFGMDFSFGGSFGLGPALVIARRRAAEPAEEAPAPASDTAADDRAADEEARTFDPAMMSGLHWSLNARPSLRLGGQSELSVLGRFGQTRLQDLTVKLGDGEDAALADVVRNGTGRWAWFTEAGVEYRIFEKPLHVVHYTKDMLLPLFAIGAGFRWDDRLKSHFDLDSFEGGDKRHYLRFVVNLTEVLDPRRTTSPDKNTFGLKLSVEHQRRYGKSEIPSSTRLMVEAAADILKLFSLGDKEKPAESGTRASETPAAERNER